MFRQLNQSKFLQLIQEKQKNFLKNISFFLGSIANAKCLVIPFPIPNLLPSFPQKKIYYKIKILS